MLRLHLSRLFCLSLLLALGVAQTAFAEGQATGKRQHKPIRMRAYIDQALNLDGHDLTLGSIMEDEGIFIVILTEDPDDWNWEVLDDFADRGEADDIAVQAVYPDTRYASKTADAREKLSKMMKVSLMDNDTRLFLPEVDDEVLVAFFNGDSKYIGAFKTVDGLDSETE